MKSILVTGGAGALGKYVCAALQKGGHQVAIFDLQKGFQEKFTFIEGSVGDKNDLEKAMEGVESVIHLAAIPYDTGNPQAIIYTNVNGTLNVLETAAKHKVKKIIFASSISVAVHIHWQPPYKWVEQYKPFEPDFLPLTEEHPCRPGDIYGASKLCGENLLMAFCKLHKLAAISLRIAPIWFPENNERMKRVVKSISDERLAVDRIWSYVDVRDVASAFRLGIERDVEGWQVYNIGADEIVGPFRSIEMVQKYYPKVKLISEPVRFSQKPNYPLWDISRAKAELGFSPKYSWEAYQTMFQ
jgi:UDP-glucose 4-epimerase